jgi:hypothetical protein
LSTARNFADFDEEIMSQMGLDMTAEEHKEYVLAKLEEARIEAEDPNTRWLTHEEVIANIARRREARACID